MTHTDRFVRHLDRLVRLLADHPDHVAEQKRAMRDACEAIAEGEVSLHATPHALLANGAPVTGTAAAAGGLAARLHSSGARRLYIARDAAPADLLRAARLLAAGESLAGLELRTVRSSSALETPLWTTLVGEPLERAEADAAAAAATERDPDFLPPGGICVPQTWSAPAALAASPAAEAAMDGAMEELASHVTPAYPPPAVAAAGAARVAEEPALSDASLVAYTMEDERPDVLTRPTPMHTERVLATDELSSRIAKLTSLAEVNRLLEELAVRAELAARDGMPAILHEVLAALVQQEVAVERQEKRLAIGIVLRRLLSTAHLRLVASLIPRQPEAREQILAVLARAENSGADAVLEHLVESESKSDRRAYFNALLQLPARETALIHMLGDQRWYVVRNAAELVGEMGLQAADGALVRALANEDDRVRKAAVSALGRLGTRTACHALRDLLRSEEGPLRGAAAMALAGTDWPYTTSALRRAFEEERDAEVRMVLLAALGRVGTDEAVAVLVEAATPPRRLLRRAASPLRVAAVRALAEAGTERARAALRRLTRDHDAEVAAVATKGAGGA